MPGALSSESHGESQGSWTTAFRDYLSWLGAVCSLDLGRSIKDGTDVAGKLWRHFKVSLLLSTTALGLIYIVAVPMGLLAASHTRSFLGKGLGRLFGLLYSLPAFWVALLLMVFFCGGDYWHLFPVTGLRSVGKEQPTLLAEFKDVAWHMILPVICLSYGGIGYMARQVRAAAEECLQADFILLARAKGLRRRTIFTRHVLPHALLPTLALLELFFPALFAGSVIVETVFSIPGMGRLSVDAVLARDFPVLMAVGLFSAIATLAGGFMIEAWLRLFRDRWEGA